MERMVVGYSSGPCGIPVISRAETEAETLKERWGVGTQGQGGRWREGRKG